MIKKIAQHLVRGLVTVAPLLLTVWLLYWATSGLEAFARPWVTRLVSEEVYMPGMGLLAALLVLAGLGVLANFFLIRWLLQIVDSVMSRIPLVKTLLSAFKDFAQLFSGEKTQQMQNVVSVELQGVKLVGFVVRDDVTLPGDDATSLVAVYFPMSFQIGGYTMYVPRDRLTAVDMPVEDAMRMVLTGGASEARK
ncbi:DUF502 domain-containing protein [Kaarinaea lacus]